MGSHNVMQFFAYWKATQNVYFYLLFTIFVYFIVNYCILHQSWMSTAHGKAQNLGGGGGCGTVRPGQSFTRDANRAKCRRATPSRPSINEWRKNLTENIGVLWQTECGRVNTSSPDPNVGAIGSLWDMEGSLVTASSETHNAFAWSADIVIFL
jgi:hypothetical protein